MATNLVIGYPDIPYRATALTSGLTTTADNRDDFLTSGQLEPGFCADTQVTREAEFCYEIGDSSAISYLALLNSRYAVDDGACWVRLIRSTEKPSLPKDITCKALYRAGEGITKDSSDFVSTWADQSGNGYNLTGAGAERPTWLTNSSDYNGNQAIRFNGTANILRSGAALGALYSGSDTPFVLAMAAKVTNTTGLQFAAGFGNETLPNPNALYSPTNGSGVKRLNRSDDAGVAVARTGGTATTAYEAIVWDFQGTTADLYVNGSLAITGTGMNVGTLTSDTFSLGAYRGAGSSSFFSAIDISEVVICNALSAPNLASLVTYMTDKHITAPPVSQALSVGALSGRRAKHFMVQFSSTALAKTWIVLSASRASRFRHSKQFLGSFLDLGRDPIYGRTTEAISDRTQQKRRRLKYDLTWRGITGAAARSFIEKIAEKSEETVFFLATVDGYHPVLQNDQIAPVYLTNYTVKQTSYDNVELVTTWEEALP